MNYLIYHPATGRILQKSFSSQGIAPIVPESMAILAIPEMDYGTFDPAKHYIDEANGGITAMSPCPSDNHVFDYASKTWIDPRSFADIQALKWEDIKKQRDIAEFAPFEYNGMVFDGDVDAQRRLAGYISVSKGAIAAGEAFSAVFTLANNTEVLLTAQDFIGIEMAKIAAVAAAFAKAADLRKQIEAAGDLTQLNTINW